MFGHQENCLKIDMFQTIFFNEIIQGVERVAQNLDL